MMMFRKAICGVMLAVISVVAATPLHAEESAATVHLQERLKVAEEHSGGVLGVAARELDSGEEIFLNEKQRFPMASTYKIAVAGAVLSRVETGELSLAQMVDVPREMYVPSDIIAARLIHSGVALSVANLIELMLTESDNTATDMLMSISGGPEGATAWLREKGVKEQRVDRTVAEIYRDFFGLPDEPVIDLFDAMDAEELAAIDRAGGLPNAAYDASPKDTTTPRAMAALLKTIAEEKALSEEHTEFLLGVMARCRTGEGRLKAQLPEGARVAHKTGTIGGSVNDVGIVTLPDGRRFVIAAYIKQSAADIPAREAAIAEAARAVYDYFAGAQ
ncbi:MAG: class A beta-lactamase [Parvularculaceae bacterium]